MGVSTYLRQAVWDFFLVACAAVPLAYVVLYAFNMSAGAFEGPLPGAAVAVLLAGLFAMAYDKRSLRIGIPVYAVACIVALGACIALEGDVYFLSDEQGNLFIGGLAVVVVATLSFALTRRLAGCAVLFAVGAFTCALVQFFYEGDLVMPTVAFLVSALALVMYKNFQLSVRTATSVRTASFGAGFATSLAAVAIAAGVGLLAWFAVIAPLDPGALELKLVTEYRALETQQVVGVSDVYQTPNTDMTSSETNDGERTTDQLIIDENGKVLASGPDNATSADEEQAEGTRSGEEGFDLDSLQDLFDIQNYERDDWMRLVLLALAVPLALAAYFVGRRVVRSRRLSRIRRKSPAQQVEGLYLFLMSRFERIGLALPDGVTISEFARSNEAHLAPFTTDAGDDFATLSEVYSSVSYGADEVTQEQADAFARFYENFWRAARKRLGPMRYLVKSVRL